MIIKELQQRIQMHQAELAGLQERHDKMVSAFQAEVGKNQSRFAQLNGAIAELTELVKLKGDNNDDSIPTPDLGDRAFDVRPCGQSQGR